MISIELQSTDTNQLKRGTNYIWERSQTALRRASNESTIEFDGTMKLSPMNGNNNSVPVSTRVVEAVAKELAKEPTELEPLYHSIAPEFLNEVFPVTEAAGNPVRQFTFTYEDHIVNVTHDGSVEVFPKGGKDPDLSPTDSTSSSRQSNPEAPD